MTRLRRLDQGWIAIAAWTLLIGLGAYLKLMDVPNNPAEPDAGEVRMIIEPLRGR